MRYCYYINMAIMPIQWEVFVAKTKFITLEANLVVNGVINYNEVQKGIGNKAGIKRAKKFGTNENSVDYTSSNCLKHNLYKTFDQKSFYDAEYNDKPTWSKLLGSELGLLRGLMNATAGLKRKSPVTVLPAESTQSGLVVVESGTSVKSSVSEEDLDKNLIVAAGIEPKATQEEKKTKKKQDGEESVDAEKSKNLFSFENAPTRVQKFVSVLSVMDLQFIPVGPRGSIAEKDTASLLEQLSTTYTRLTGKEHTFKLGKYSLRTQVSPVSQLGILLPVDMQVALVNKWLELCKELHAFSSNARLYIDLTTTKIGVNVHEASLNVDLNENVEAGELEQFYVESK